MTAREHSSATRWIVVALTAFVVSIFTLPLLGSSPLDWSRLMARQEPDWSILVQLRLSRTLLGLLSGGTLALGGSVFQAMLRDGLATPDTLGVSSGASLGAVVAIALGWHVGLGIAGIWLGACAGAALVLVAVLLSTGRRDTSSNGLLLAGLATNSLCWALILVVHSMSGMAQSFAISRWLIGSLDAVEYRSLAVFAAAALTIAALIIRRARDWNLLAVGEAWAGTRGVHVPRLLRFGYIAGSALSAATVAFTGPIGFIALIVPHLVRVRISADDRLLMPCAFLFGGVLLATCDAVGRACFAPLEIPAGAMTAFLGAPYLIWLLRRRPA